jgi:hypothetical protein
MWEVIITSKAGGLTGRSTTAVSIRSRFRSGLKHQLQLSNEERFGKGLILLWIRNIQELRVLIDPILGTRLSTE